MNPTEAKRISKFLSLVLRHQPEKIELELDPAGWVSVDELLEKVSAKAFRLNREMLEAVVKDNDKQRFAFSDDGERIRASQGHSIGVELDYQPMDPPEILYHGTSRHFLAGIRATGLEKRQRHHVHLSADRETARKVGQRHGPPVILTVMAGEMRRAGHAFYRSANGVWLTEAVAPEFLQGLSP